MKQVEVLGRGLLEFRCPGGDKSQLLEPPKTACGPLVERQDADEVGPAANRDDPQTPAAVAVDGPVDPPPLSHPLPAQRRERRRGDIEERPPLPLQCLQVYLIRDQSRLAIGCNVIRSLRAGGGSHRFNFLLNDRGPNRDQGTGRTLADRSPASDDRKIQRALTMAMSLVLPQPEFDLECPDQPP